MPENQITTKHFTKNDRRTSVADTLRDADGAAIDLTGSTVAFRMVSFNDDGTVSEAKVDSQAATIDEPATAGKVSYAWGESDLNTAGTYWYWWIVTTAGKTERFPGDGKKRRLIVEESY